MYRLGAWSPAESRFNEYVLVDLGSDHVITSVATQGRSSSAHEWVTSYWVEYSSDGVDYTRIEVIDGYTLTFNGNT